MVDFSAFSHCANAVFSLCVPEDGELYLWGKLLNPKGKAESNGDQIVPRLVRTSDAVKLFKCSQFHTTFITGEFAV